MQRPYSKKAASPWYGKVHTRLVDDNGEKFSKDELVGNCCEQECHVQVSSNKHDHDKDRLFVCCPNRSLSATVSVPCKLKNFVYVSEPEHVPPNWPRCTGGHGNMHYWKFTEENGAAHFQCWKDICKGTVQATSRNFTAQLHKNCIHPDCGGIREDYIAQALVDSQPSSQPSPMSSQQTNDNHEVPEDIYAGMNPKVFRLLVPNDAEVCLTRN
jgi:hypothetical protein